MNHTKYRVWLWVMLLVLVTADRQEYSILKKAVFS